MWPERDLQKEPKLIIGKNEQPAVFAWLTLLFGWTLAPLAGYDFWFYIAVGRDIFTQRRIPYTESYLGTTAGYGFGNYAETAWLGNLLTYGVYLWGGYLGLVMLKSLLLTLSTGVVYYSNRISGMSPFWAGAWSSLALWTIRGRFEMRLYLITTLALALLSLFLIILERGGSRKQGIASLSLLFLLWSNLHQGILAGYIVLGSWLVFGRRTFKDRLVFVTVAVFSSLLRPNVTSLPAFYYDHFSNSSAMQGIVEWSAVSWEQRLTQLSPFYLVLLALVFVTFRRLVRREPVPPNVFGVTLVAFSVMGWRSYRSIAELLPVVSPMAATYMPQLSKNRRLHAVISVLLVTAFGTTFDSRNLRALSQSQGMPSKLCQVIPKKGQVFNSFEFGNFLVFQEIPPFIHGMSAFYREQLILDFEDVLNPSPRRDEILARYDITSALLHFPTEDDATSLLVEYLSNSKDWKLQAWDDNALLFVKGPKQSGLMAVQPWKTPGWTDPKAAEDELRSILEHDPSALAHILLSRLLLARGDIGEATAHATKATQMSSTSPASWTQLGGCYAKAANLTGLLLATEEAISLAPDVPQIRLNRSLALYSASQNQDGIIGKLKLWQARHLARSAVKLEPSLEPSARTVLKDS